MTKQELFEVLDWQEGDKVIIMRVRDRGEKFYHQRINDGFSSIELLGMFERAKADVVDQMRGKKYDTTETERVIIKRDKKDDKFNPPGMYDIKPVVGKHYTMCGKKVIAIEYVSNNCTACAFDGSGECASIDCRGIHYEEIE